MLLSFLLDYKLLGEALLPSSSPHRILQPVGRCAMKGYGIHVDFNIRTERVFTSLLAVLVERAHLRRPLVLLALTKGGGLWRFAFFPLIFWVLEVVNKLKSIVLAS